MKLAHQLADETVDRSEVDKYRDQVCKDMTKPSEIARPAPAAKTGDDCEVKMPQKVIKPPDTSQTYLVELRVSGKANLLDVLQSHRCAEMPVFSAETEIGQKDTLRDSAVNVAPSRSQAAHAAQR